MYREKKNNISYFERLKLTAYTDNKISRLISLCYFTKGCAVTDIIFKYY